MPDQVIMQNLQAQKVPVPEVQDAMMQADIKMRVGGGGAGGPVSPAISAPPQMLPQALMPPQGGEYQGAMAAGMMAPPPLGGPQPMMMMMGPPSQQMMMEPQQLQQQQQMGPPQIPPEFLAPHQQQQQQQGGPQMAPMPMGPPPAQFGPQEQQPPMPMGPPSGMYPSPMPQMGISTEELVEKIVSEKLDRLEKRLSDQEKIHSDLLQQIGQVRSTVNDLKGKYVQLQEDSVVKIEEYNKELEGVGTQIKAMQRVMQNIIPTFAENVRSLTEVVRELKGGGGGVGPERPPQQILTREAPQQQQRQQLPPQRRPAIVQPVRPARLVAVRPVAEEEEGEGEEGEAAAGGPPWEARVRNIAKRNNRDVESTLF